MDIAIPDLGRRKRIRDFLFQALLKLGVNLIHAGQVFVERIAPTP
jgi:hypothetical protein